MYSLPFQHSTYGDVQQRFSLLDGIQDDGVSRAGTTALLYHVNLHVECRQLRVHNLCNAVAAWSQAVPYDGLQVLKASVKGNAREKIIIDAVDGASVVDHSPGI